MRPLELTIRNFRSYFGDDVVIDLRDRGLVGVVGPIGSGKSSLLDAIAFALYGRTPTSGRHTKALIHQRADRATVSLRFSVNDEIWEVTRALRRKGQGMHGLFHLETDDPESVQLEKFVLEAEVNERIVDLLGLEWDGFSRSIMLAQGRFAEFLSAQPAERDKVLKGVFGHDRIDVMRSEAKIRTVTEANRAETLAVRLEAADALAGRIAAIKEQVALDEARLELLRKAETKFADQKERLDATARIISHADARTGELEPMAERMPVPDVVTEVVKVSKNAQDMRTRLGETLGAAQLDLAATEKALTKLDPKAMRARIDEATRLTTVLDQLTTQHKAAVNRHRSEEEASIEAAHRLDRLQADLAAANSHHAAVEARLTNEIRENELATKALHVAQHENMADTLREHLEIGAPCPVCDQSVAVLPADVATPEMAAAEAAAKSAALEVEALRESLVEATAGVGELREVVSAIEAEIKGLNKEHAATAKQVTRLESDTAEVTASLAEVCATGMVADLRQELDRAETAVGDARKRVDIARAEHDEAIRSETAAGKELATLRLSLAELATRLDTELPSTDDVDAIVGAVGKVRQAWADSIETLSTAKQAAERERSELAAADRLLRSELAIEGEFAAHLAETVAAIGVRRRQIQDDEATLAESDEVRAARDGAIAQKKTYETLASDLTDSKFVRYLLDEEKRALANLGSEHFERLSSGRYRFTDDGGFNIMDLTSADAVRKADSLSGGETFLASLALALALAEMVARVGGRLDAFFLDEGFGSLDPEHLDLAMEGIEQLAAGASDRLVLVVSHVPDMRDRLEDLIELDRNPVTGDTVVVHS
ncbi:MAG: SMC family ATPase [bacterium]|nr:SMC family ATPase [bacterium]